MCILLLTFAVLHGGGVSRLPDICTCGLDLHDGVRPRNRPDLEKDGTVSFARPRCSPNALGTYAPDSAMTVLISRAMYCTGVPSGGVARNWMRDFTTSAENAVEATMSEDGDGRTTHLTDSMLTSTQSAKAT